MGHTILHSYAAFAKGKKKPIVVHRENEKLTSLSAPMKDFTAAFWRHALTRGLASLISQYHYCCFASKLKEMFQHLHHIQNRLCQSLRDRPRFHISSYFLALFLSAKSEYSSLISWQIGWLQHSASKQANMARPPLMQVRFKVRNNLAEPKHLIKYTR